MLRLFEFFNARIANKAGLYPRAVTDCAIWDAQMGDKICELNPSGLFFSYITGVGEGSKKGSYLIALNKKLCCK